MSLSEIYRGDGTLQMSCGNLAILNYRKIGDRKQERLIVLLHSIGGSEIFTSSLKSF